MFIMKNFLQKLRIKFLSFKVERIKSKLKSIAKKLNPSEKSISKDTTILSVNSCSQAEIEAIKEKVNTIIKNADGSCDELIKYIENEGTCVYKFKNADKILKQIDEEQGFILEKRGIAALYISFFTKHELKFQTAPMFVIDVDKIELYAIICGLYKWYSYKSGLAGFDYETNKKFKYYMKHLGHVSLKRLNIDEIELLQEAVKRDQEATDFTLEYAKNIEGSEKVIDKINNSGFADI